VRQARQGNVSGPLKAALDVLRDLRNEVRLAVDHGGLDGASYRDELTAWYTPFNAFLSIGPPASRIAGTPVEALVSDEAWLQAMLDAEAALARARARLGTVPPQAAAVITRAAQAPLYDVRALAVAVRRTANPIVGLVAALTARVAEVDPAAGFFVDATLADTLVNR
jgi:hypothetical protein